MKSQTTKRFRESFELLPLHIQKSTERAYIKWKVNPQHPGLQFKKIYNALPLFSVRISLGYRAPGIKEGNTIVWFWIGSHTEYDQLITGIKNTK